MASKEPWSRRQFLIGAGGLLGAVAVARLRVLRLQDEVEPQGFLNITVTADEVFRWTVQTLYGPARYSARFSGVPGGPLRVVRWQGQNTTYPPSDATVIDVGITCRGETYVDPEYCPVRTSDPGVLALVSSYDTLAVKVFNGKVKFYNQWLPMMNKNAN